MKKVFILLIGILVVSCNQDKSEKPKPIENSSELNEAVDNFDWLLGKWKMSNEEVGKETFENWDKKSKTEYVGFSYTMQKEDTLKHERFKLVKSNGNWSFKIRLQGEVIPSSFKMTSSNAQEFVCENKSLNFPNRKFDSPNKIKYWKKEDKLYAGVSGKKINLQFEYIKIDD